jgi:23S rRNA (cytidine1920-2'-O)/16S rRNA (cytidine1409-2'-O)-methyltransferase
MTRRRRRHQLLSAVVQQRWPQLDSGAATQAITAGDVLVEGRPVTNPRSLVEADASVRLAPTTALQGERKLSWAIERFSPNIAGRVALDVGACTGGFTTALLGAGAAKVYAVDAGFGQLRGALAQDERVVNLERTNVGQLDQTIVADPIGVVTVDVSYLALAAAVAQLTAAVDLDAGAELLGLVKPMFELRLAAIPADRPTLETALAQARAGVEAAGWTALGADECPVRGKGGAVEFFVHARVGATGPAAPQDGQRGHPDRRDG